MLACIPFRSLGLLALLALAAWCAGGEPIRQEISLDGTWRVQRGGADLPTTYRIVNNTADQQAVAWDDRRCAVVFWQPGTITWATGRSLQAAAPCLVDIDGEQVAVSDPTWKLTQIDLQIDGKPVPMTLPTAPGYAGSTITISNPNL